MRAGLLSEPVVLNAIEESFVCSWALPNDVKKLEENGKTKAIRSLAQRLMEDYHPLVHIMVLNQRGEIVDQLYVNEQLLFIYQEVIPPSDEVIDFFLSFLNKAAEKARD